MLSTSTKFTPGKPQHITSCCRSSPSSNSTLHACPAVVTLIRCRSSGVQGVRRSCEILHPSRLPASPFGKFLLDFLISGISHDVCPRVWIIRPLGSLECCIWLMHCTGSMLSRSGAIKSRYMALIVYRYSTVRSSYSYRHGRYCISHLGILAPCYLHSLSVWACYHCSAQRISRSLQLPRLQTPSQTAHGGMLPQRQTHAPV